MDSDLEALAETVKRVRDKIEYFDGQIKRLHAGQRAVGYRVDRMGGGEMPEDTKTDVAVLRNDLNHLTVTVTDGFSRMNDKLDGISDSLKGMDETVKEHGTAIAVLNRTAIRWDSLKIGAVIGGVAVVVIVVIVVAAWALGVNLP